VGRPRITIKGVEEELLRPPLSADDPRLVDVPRELTFKARRLHHKVLEPLRAMLDEAIGDGLPPLRVSGAWTPQRFSTVQNFRDYIRREYGSKGHLWLKFRGVYESGLAIDLVNDDMGLTRKPSTRSESYRWLEENAERFGFVPGPRLGSWVLTLEDSEFEAVP